MVRLRGPDGNVYSRTFRTRKDAERFEREELASRDRGTWVNPASRKVTLAEWVDMWLEQPDGRRDSTRYAYRADMRRYILPSLGTLPLGAITPRHVNTLVGSLASEFGLSPHTVAKVFRTLKACLNAAVDAELIWRAPFAGVRLPKAVIDARPVGDLLAVAAIANNLSPHLRASAFVLGYEGLRRGEMLGLRVRDLDLLNARLTVRFQVTEVVGRGTVVGDPKTEGSARTVQLVRSTVDELAAHLARRAWSAADSERFLFGPGDGLHPLSPSAYSRQFRSAAGRAGLAAVTPHTLRKIATTALVGLGVDPKTVQVRLGHTSLQTTMTYYAKAPDAAQRVAADALEHAVRSGSPRDIRAMVSERSEAGGRRQVP
jgi:integrase